MAKRKTKQKPQQKLRRPRPALDTYKMTLAVEVATRSNCLSTHVGAIIMRDSRIRATGYNGTPEVSKDCFDGGCVRCRDRRIPSGQQLDKCICVHAEENAIAGAARHGIEIANSECYSTHEPCLSCTKLLIQAHVSRVIYLVPYKYQDSPDQQKARTAMRNASQKRKNGTKFLQFKDIVRRREDRELIRGWGKRLADMRTAAMEYARKKRVLIEP